MMAMKHTRRSMHRISLKMNKQIYNLIADVCMFFVIVSGLLFDRYPEHGILLGTIVGLSALVAIVTYFFNQWIKQ